MICRSIVNIFLCLTLIITITVNTAYAEVIELSVADLNPSQYNMTFVKKQLASELDSWIYEYKHKSGATIVYLDNGKDEKGFSIGFKTPPANNNGANHVLEHSVLCGSVKYPSRDIQTYMESTSVPTFMNAFTGNDFTFYAVSSKNQKAFQNLVDVYVNAVFDPMLLKNENIFKQQGVRLEYSEDKVKYNGIVYNEMASKTDNGIVSRVNSTLYDTLFGNSKYNRSSGGTTDGLKQLTYDEVVTTFNNYYKPSNALITLTGKQDLSLTFRALNDYLNKFDSGIVTISEKSDGIIAENASKVIYSNIQAQDSVSVGILFSGTKLTDMKETYAFNALNAYINNSLQKEGTFFIGDSMGGITSYGVIIENTSNKEAFLKEYDELVKSLFGKPLDYKQWEQCLLESNGILKSHHIYSVSDALLKGFVYSNNPLAFINSQNVIDELMQPQNEKYIKEVLVKYFINNKNKAIVEVRNGTENTKNVAKQVDSAEIQKLLLATEQYNKWVNTPESEEILSKRPILSLNDFKDKELGFSVDKGAEKGIEYFYTISDKKNTASLSFVFDTTSFEQELLLDSKLLVDLYNAYIEKNKISGIAFNISTYNNFYDRTKYNSALNVTVSGKRSEIKDKVLQLKEILSNLSSIINNETKIQVVNIKGLTDYYVNILEVFNYSSAATSHGNRFSLLSYGVGGYGTHNYLQYLKKTSEDTNLELKLQSAHKMLFNQNKLSVSITGNKEEINFLKEQAKQLYTCLDTKVYKHKPADLPKALNSSAFIDSTFDENIVKELAFSGNIKDNGFDYSPKLQVLMKYIESAYLYPKMRGLGAYGAHITVDTDGSYVLSIGKSPDIHKSLDTIYGIKDFVKSSNLTQSELDNYIISCVNVWDGWFDISEGNQVGFAKDMQLRGYSQDDILKARNEMLSTTVDDILSLIDTIDFTRCENVFLKSNKVVLEDSGLKFDNVIEMNK